MFNVTAPFNLTPLQNSSTITDLVIQANSYTGNILATLFIISLFFIMIFRFSRNTDFSHGLLVTSFICLVVSLMFAYISMVSFYIVVIFLLIFLLDAFYVFLIVR